jgi:O-antigen/teichoic acid export membrane protein
MTSPAKPKLFSMSTIVKNVTSNWAGLAVGMIIAFVLGPLTVRSLGNTYYGVWTLLMQLTGYLWLFDFGVRESVVKYVSQYHASDDQDSVNTTVNTAITLYGCVSLGALVLAVILAGILPYAFNIPEEASRTARLTALLSGATIAQAFVFNVFVGVLMGLQKFYVLSRLGLLFGILRGFVLYLLLTNGFGIIALALLQFSATLIQNLVIYWFCRRSLPYLSLQPSWPQRAEALKLLHYGKFVLLSNLGDKVVFATNTIVIGVFMPISALTYFAIAGNLIELLRSVITSMASIFNPLSSSLEARNETKALGAVVTNGARAAMIVGLPACIGFFLLGESFIELWMGPEYAPQASQVLLILTAGHMIGLPYYTLSGVLYGLSRHRVIAYSRLIEGAINLTLSVVLVQQYGLAGVAIGTAAPQILMVAAILPRLLSQWVPINLRDYYLSTYVRPLAASLPFWAVCWWIAHVVRPANFLTFFVAITAGLVAYVVPCWLVVFSASERAMLAGPVLRRLPGHRAVEGLT